MVSTPKASAFRYINNDLSAGVVVFLVAVPLCLGIALASEAPLFSGVIAGIIGGIVVSIFSGSEISVSGPAAGLAVIVATSIATLGSFEAFLLAAVIAGFLQLFLAFLRAGAIGNYFPNSVIKGMLAAIGIVIVLKQIPHALGRDTSYEGDFSFLNMGAEGNTATDILSAMYSFSPGAVVISVLGLGILLLWEYPVIQRIRLLRLIPAGLIVVMLGIVLNGVFSLVMPSWALRGEHLVQLPTPESIVDFGQYLISPDFSAINRKEVWIAAFTLAFIGSLETLLSLEAADKIDPLKRISDPNKELMAQGIGNILSGLFGGLPITAVIVRSSANVYAGGRTRLSAVFHGVLLLMAALLFPRLINYIPLAALAAILIAVGYKLAKVKLFVTMYRTGRTQFIPFVITVLAIVFTDLLYGIIIGMVVGFYFSIKANIHSAVTLIEHNNVYMLRLKKDMSFTHKAELKKALQQIPDGATVYIDGTRAMFIDQDIYDTIADFGESAELRHIEISYRNFHTAPFERLIHNPIRQILDAYRGKK